MPVVAFADLADAALDEIRHAARGHPALLIRLRETIAAVAARARPDADRAALRRHARRIREASGAARTEMGDRAHIETRGDAARAALGTEPQGEGAR